MYNSMLGRGIPTFLEHSEAPHPRLVQAPEVVSLVALVAQHHLACSPPCATNLAVHEMPPVDSLKVSIVVQDGERVVGNVLDQLLDFGSTTSLQYRHSRWPDLHYLLHVRSGWRVKSVVHLLPQQHVLPRLKRCLGPIPATITHHFVAILVPLLSNGQIHHCQGHHSL